MKKITANKINSNEVLEAIDQLARSVKKEFDNAADNFNEFRGEFKEFRKEATQALFALDNKVQETDSRLKRVEETLEPLFTGYKIMQKEIQELNSRIERVEKKQALYKS